MNFKNISAVAILVVAVAFAIQLVQQPQAEAQPTAPAQPVVMKAKVVQYAMLRVDDDGANVTWLIGGNQPVRTESVRATFLRLGGNGQSTFTDLLNQIGSDGWNLVEKDDNLWIFSR